MNRMLRWSGIAGLALVAALTTATPSAIAAGTAGGSGGLGAMGRMSDPREDITREIDVQGAYQAGIAALSARNYGTAIAQFRDVLQAQPTDALANYYLGVAYIGSNDARSARRPLERATRRNDAPADAWVQLGLLYNQAGDRRKAEEQLGELAQMIAACAAPQCADARRAQLQAAHDQLQQALTGTAPAAPTTGWLPPGVGEGRAAFAVAVGLINNERYADALAQLALAREAIGPSADVLNYMGFASRKLQRYDEAMAYYNQALELNPRHIGATEYLGELYIELGRMDDARRQLARLGQLCTYGCAEHEELQRWIVTASR